MWYIYTMKYYPTIKKNEIMSFSTTWMDLEIVTLSGVSPRKRNIIWHPLYVESKKKLYKWTYLQNRRFTFRQWTCGCQRGRTGEKDRKFGMNMCTLYLKWITNKDLWYTAQGTLLNVMWQPGWEWSLGETGYMDVYGWVHSLFTWNYHNIVNQYNTKQKAFLKKDKLWLKKRWNKKKNEDI